MNTNNIVELYLQVKRNVKYSKYMNLLSLILSVVLLVIAIYKNEFGFYYMIASYWLGWSSRAYDAESQKKFVAFLEMHINNNKKYLEERLKKS